MKSYRLLRKQTLHCNIQKAWSFFSNPKNLNLLTPADMSFEILSDQPLPMIYEHQIINYRIRPLLNLPMKWETEIVDVKALNYFTDIQRKGPFKLWKHKHSFEEVNGKVVMIDELNYALPLGILGRLAHTIFVKAKLNSIFDYRYKKVEDIFNQMH